MGQQDACCGRSGPPLRVISSGPHAAARAAFTAGRGDGRRTPGQLPVRYRRGNHAQVRSRMAARAQRGYRRVRVSTCSCTTSQSTRWPLEQADASLRQWRARRQSRRQAAGTHINRRDQDAPVRNHDRSRDVGKILRGGKEGPQSAGYNQVASIVGIHDRSRSMSLSESGYSGAADCMDANMALRCGYRRRRYRSEGGFHPEPGWLTDGAKCRRRRNSGCRGA
jgi:hypothetical protein